MLLEFRSGVLKNYNVHTAGNITAKQRQAWFRFETDQGLPCTDSKLNRLMKQMHAAASFESTTL